MHVVEGVRPTRTVRVASAVVWVLEPAQVVVAPMWFVLATQSVSSWRSFAVFAVFIVCTWVWLPVRVDGAAAPLRRGLVALAVAGGLLLLLGIPREVVVLLVALWAVSAGCLLRPRWWPAAIQAAVAVLGAGILGVAMGLLGLLLLIPLAMLFASQVVLGHPARAVAAGAAWGTAVALAAVVAG